MLLPPCFLLPWASAVLGLQSHLGGQDVAAKHSKGGEPARRNMAACDDNLPSAYCPGPAAAGSRCPGLCGCVLIIIEVKDLAGSLNEGADMVL